MTADIQVHVHVHVSGRVQGVSYRAFCAEEARRLGLRGWVRNLPDGRVEAVFQGPRPNIDRMVAWWRRGSPAARVSDVTVGEEACSPFEDFSVQFRAN